MKRSFIATIVMLGVEANLSVYCEPNTANSAPIVGNLAEYKACGTNCSCFIFELLCIEKYLKTDQYQLFKRTPTQAKDCTNCICNSNKAAWEEFEYKGESLPMTPKIPIADYTTLSLASR